MQTTLSQESKVIMTQPTLPNKPLVADQSASDLLNLPYFPISQFYREFFGGKTLKIPVSVPGSCPNRDGLNGMEVCNFCDEWGSAAYPENRDAELIAQMVENRERVLRKGKGTDKFLIYFQSYTFSFSRVARLRSFFEAAAQFDWVCGFVVGTRPDCISDAVLDLWEEYSEKLPVFIEFGAQSFVEEQLEWMKRGHSAKKNVWAVKRLAQKVPALNVGVHLMFGLPGESDQQLIETAQLINDLPIHNVKLHNLHVLKNTPLELDFQKGLFTPIELDEYCRRTGLFLQHLHPQTPVHRLAANATRAEELVAPQWTGDKMRTYQYMLDYLNDRSIKQGQKFVQAPLDPGKWLVLKQDILG